jgi:hypothetical protein
MSGWVHQVVAVAVTGQAWHSLSTVLNKIYCFSHINKNIVHIGFTFPNLSAPYITWVASCAEISLDVAYELDPPKWLLKMNRNANSTTERFLRFYCSLHRCSWEGSRAVMGLTSSLRDAAMRLSGDTSMPLWISLLDAWPCESTSNCYHFRSFCNAFVTVIRGSSDVISKYLILPSKNM